jgi:hypothetical protein
MVRSGTPLMVVGSEAESLLVFVSPPPDTVTVLVTLAGALLATLTASVIAGKLPAAATTVVLVQVTVWLAIPQLQPVPVALAGVSPAGTVSVTVAVPLVGPFPTLLTVIV